MKITIVVTDIVNDVKYSHKSKYMCGHNTFYYITLSTYDKRQYDASTLNDI